MSEVVESLLLELPGGFEGKGGIWSVLAIVDTAFVGMTGVRCSGTLCVVVVCSASIRKAIQLEDPLLVTSVTLHVAGG